MKKAVYGSDGYCKLCLLCGGYIENKMYETVTYKKGRTGYVHTVCYNRTKIKNKMKKNNYTR